MLLRLQRTHLGLLLLYIIISISEGFVPYGCPHYSSYLPTKAHKKRASADKAARDQAESNDEESTRSTTTFSELENDLTALTKLCPPQASADHSIPPAIVSAGSSYTRLWTHHTWKIHSDPPHKRYSRHLIRWPLSTTARKILPTVLCSCFWSLLVAIVATYSRQTTATNKLSGVAVAAKLTESTSQAFTFLSAPLALLLTLRANASMSRLLEARQAWGRLVLNARSLSSIVKTYITPTNPRASALIIRYLALLGWILKARVRGEDEKHQQKLLQTMLGCEFEEYQWLSAHSKRPVGITSRIRHIAALALLSQQKEDDHKRGFDQSATQLVIEERIRELEAVIGACERLFGSPIPPTYTRHLSRVMSMWILLLPLSLVSSAPGLSILGILCTSMVSTYVFVGLDEVGMEIENAFQLLPLQELSGAAQKDIKDQFFTKMPTLR